jgi:hypothetical protein
MKTKIKPKYEVIGVYSEKEISPMRNPIYKMVEQIAKQRAEILDNFCKAYLADTGIPISKLELVEEHKTNKYIWSFRIKRGRPKKIK